MSFGKNKNDQKGTQNQQFSGTDTHNTDTTYNQTGTTATAAQQRAVNPAWVDATAAALNGGISSLSGMDPRSFVAGPDALQTQAAAGAGGLSGSPWNFDSAADLTRGVAGATAPHLTGVTADGYIQRYQDPFMDSVVNSTLADFDHQAGLTRAQDDLALTGAGAFGGSGAALTKSATEGELARGRATTESGLRSQGFAQALAAAQQDAQRQQAAKELNAQLQGQQMDRTLGAAKQLGDISTQYDTNQRANITTQAQLGDAMRQIQQQYATSPIDFQNALTQLFAGLPLNLFHGQDNTGTQNTTENGTQNEKGVEDQSGTSSGSSTGNSSGLSFGFKVGGK